MLGRRLAGIVVALTAVSSLLAGTPAHATGCSSAEVAGGDWSMYGHDLSNTRNQTEETTISPANVTTIAAAWTFSPLDEGGTGTLQSTPVVAEGCVYVTTSSGYIYALNADTGEFVWKDRLAETVIGVCCGGTLFAPSVHDGVVYVNVSQNAETSPDLRGPFVVAMDSQTGERLWTTVNVAAEAGAYTNSSAVYYDGMIFIGISNPEMGYHYIGGFSLVDAATGDIIKRTHTVPPDQATDFAGGSIWSTAAVDTDTGYAYAGTGQPSDWAGNESEFVNAIVKIDLARARDSAGAPVPSATITNPYFGEIVDAAKGTWDDPPYTDVDFAGSPTLYTDANGQKMVAEFQKSGWLHAAYTRQMASAWSIPLSPIGTALGNYSSTATDGSGNIFGVGTYPGQMWSINGTTGDPNWVSPVITTLGGNPVTYANGVVYHADGKGFLDAYDGATGLPLLHRPMSADAGGLCTNMGGGVSIARGTVYSVCGDRNVQAAIGPNDGESGWLIAYRPA